LENHAWPGNVRELQSALRYAMVHAAGEILTADGLPDSLRSAAPAPESPSTPRGELSDVAQLVQQMLHAGRPDIYREVAAAFDRVVLDEVLRHVRGNQLQAAELLGISRTTLRAKLRSLGLTVGKALLENHESGNGRMIAER
jgi:two-component system nitrogen regulation response regulator GlnG